YVGGRRALALGDAEHAGELGVLDRGCERGLAELEGDVEDDVAPGVGLEAARAVAEVALGGGERAHGTTGAVPHPDAGDGLRDVLTVGADVLDGRRPDRARDARERLDPHPAALDGE